MEPTQIVSCPICGRTITVRARIKSVALGDAHGGATITVRVKFKEVLVNHRCYHNE